MKRQDCLFNSSIARASAEKQVLSEDHAGVVEFETLRRVNTANLLDAIGIVHPE
jgi:hypothetical protein